MRKPVYEIQDSTNQPEQPQRMARRIWFSQVTTWLILGQSSNHFSHVRVLIRDLTVLGSSVGRVSAPRSGGTGFNPGPRHTKVVKNGTSCSPLGTQIFGVGLGLVASVSV